MLFLTFDAAMKVFMHGARHRGDHATRVSRERDPADRPHPGRLPDRLPDPAHVRARRDSLDGYLGGAIATHVRVGSPLSTHTLFPIYVAALLWAGLWLRDHRVRALLSRRHAHRIQEESA